jgi:hypothetical protein
MYIHFKTLVPGNGHESQQYCKPSCQVLPFKIIGVFHLVDIKLYGLPYFVDVLSKRWLIVQPTKPVYIENTPNDLLNLYVHILARSLVYQKLLRQFGDLDPFVDSQSRQSARLFLQSSELEPPLHHLQASVSLPLWFRGGWTGHTRLREGEGGGGGVPIPMRRQTL